MKRTSGSCARSGMRLRRCSVRFTFYVFFFLRKRYDGDVVVVVAAGGTVRRGVERWCVVAAAGCSSESASVDAVLTGAGRERVQGRVREAVRGCVDADIES